MWKSVPEISDLICFYMHLLPMFVFIERLYSCEVKNPNPTR